MNRIKIDEHDGKVKIAIKPDQKGIVSLTYTIMALVFIMLGAGCFYLLFFTNRAVIMSAFFLLIFWGLCFIFLKRTYSKDLIIIQHDEMKLGSSFIFKSLRSYKLKDVKNIRIENENFAEHELHRKPLDYFGIGTEQQNVNNLIADGRIAFDYKNTIIRFGKDLYFEDANIVLSKIQNYTS